MTFCAFVCGGVESIRRNRSSNPIAGASSLGSTVGKLRFGGGFDSFPDFVARELGTVGEALAFDALEDSRGALHVVNAELGAMVPAKVKLGRVALQVGL